MDMVIVGEDDLMTDLFFSSDRDFDIVAFTPMGDLDPGVIYSFILLSHSIID